MYCAQAIQTGTPPTPLPLLYTRLKSDLQTAQKQGAPPFELAFYGGTFTGLSPVWIRKFLDLVRPYRSAGLIKGIRCSTRPDALNSQQLTELKAQGLDLIELGIQSFSERVLSLSRRGYSGQKAREGCRLVLKSGLDLGIQLLPGLPGSDRRSWFKDLRQTIAIRPQMVRIYPCLVLKGTPLEALWATGRYAPWNLKETVSALSRGLIRLSRARIPVSRIGLAQEKGLLDNLLAGPWHPALGALIKSRVLFYSILCRAILLGPGPKKLFCPRPYQGQIFGHRGHYRQRYQTINIQPTDIAFCEHKVFRLQHIAEPRPASS